jgi:hypothetical protein
MNKPTTQQIEQIAADHAKSLGNAVHLQASEVALAVDSRFPGLTDDEFAAVKVQCVATVGALRGAALHAMWGAA